jgi:hypothetical protein
VNVVAKKVSVKRGIAGPVKMKDDFQNEKLKMENGKN